MNEQQKEIERNKVLIEKYPFLLPYNRWTGEVVKNYNYSYTELDDMPQGWRIKFGEEICEEIKQALVKRNCLDKYRIIQIKEKFGFLHWYSNYFITEVEDIIRKYEAISVKTCIICGKDGKMRDFGWISPYCDECNEKILKRLIKTNKEGDK